MTGNFILRFPLENDSVFHILYLHTFSEEIGGPKITKIVVPNTDVILETVDGEEIDTTIIIIGEMVPWDQMEREWMEIQWTRSRM